MQRRLAGSILGFALLLLPAAGHARQASVSAADGWVAVPPAGTTSAPAYVEIRNPTMYDVYVVSVEADAAATVELREKVGAGPESKTVKELTVPAFGSLALEPGGSHVLLKDLKRALKAGETVALTLKTDGGVTLQVAAVVR